MQLILAVLMRLELRKYGLKHNFHHSSQMTVADLLQRFSRDYGAVNLKVNRQVPQMAIWVDDTLAIDNKVAYRKDAFSSLVVMKTLLGGLIQHEQGMGWYVKAQKFIFLLQLLAIVISIVFQTTIGGVFAICAGLLCIVLTVLVERQQANLLNVVLRRTSELLDWDNVEQAKASKLINQFEGEGYWYVTFPVTLVKDLLKDI